MAENELQLRVAQAMRRRRERLGVSQEAFAETIDLHRTYYSSIERGERNVSLKNLGVIAQGLGVALSKLMAEAERTALPQREVPLRTRTKRARFAR